MRWHFTDKIEAFEPWRMICTRKAVSLEEGCFNEIFDREGIMPESLLLEACVEAARWLTAASSGFEKVAVLAGIDGFAFHTEAAIGDVLAVAVEIADQTDRQITATCRITSNAEIVAEGRLAADMLPLADHLERGITEDMWRELHGTT